jgi:hypothetical protein
VKEKLQEYALVAEILGGIAIVISLLFVGFQITDGNRETRAATTQSVLDAEMYFQTQLISNADVWEKVVYGGDMSDIVETRKAIALFNMMVTQNDVLFQMQKSGYIEYSEIEVGGFAAPNFLKVWRQSPGANTRSPEFMEMVDNQLFRE